MRDLPVSTIEDVERSLHEHRYVADRSLATTIFLGLTLYKLPGIAETLDWTRSLLALGQRELDEAAVEVTLGSIVKYQEDLERLRGAGSRELLARAALA